MRRIAKAFGLLSRISRDGQDFGPALQRCRSVGPDEIFVCKGVSLTRLHLQS